MPISQGIQKRVVVARQTAKGVLAPVGGGQIMRRESATFGLSKEAYTTESEMTNRRQILSSRHGVRSVAGAVQGIFSPGTYADPLAALLMRDFTVIADITGASVTIAGTGPYTLTRAAGSYLTDGYKIGYIVRLTAGAFVAGNMQKNLLIVGVTALVLTVIALNEHTLTAEGPVAAATVSVPGKVTWVPETGHTNIYYTVEQFNPETPQSERNVDVKFTQAAISLPGSGNASINFTAMGLNQTTDPAAYFTAPLPETITDALTAASGALFIGGVMQSVVTDVSMTIDGTGTAADASVGRNIKADIFMGKLKVSGTFTAYHESTVLGNFFINEVRTSIVMAMTSGTTPNAGGVSFILSNVDFSSADPDDAETGLKRTYNFTGIFNSLGGVALATGATTIAMQDTAA